VSHPAEPTGLRRPLHRIPGDKRARDNYLLAGLVRGGCGTMHARHFVTCVTLSGGSRMAAVVRSAAGRWLKQVDGTVAIDRPEAVHGQWRSQVGSRVDAAVRGVAGSYSP
jgi:hypothetical protein